jgi:hypothetical protein
MAQTIGLDEGRRRAILHNKEDGLGEIALGAAMLLSGLMGIALATRWSFLGFLLMVPFCGMAFAMRRLKAQIAFPRTGYVALPDPPHRQRILVPVLVVASFLAFDAAEPTLMPFLKHRAIAFPLGFAVLLAGIFIVGAFQYRMWYRAFPAGAALGAAVWIWTRGRGEGTFWVLAVVGAALILSGTLRLVQFLRRYPKPA